MNKTFNKKIALMLFAIMLLNVMPLFNISAYADDNAEEIINNPVFVGVNLIEKINPELKYVDISGVANRAFKDDVAGDGKGGWSDQGDNDLRNFTQYGNVKYRGIRFNIINPEKNANKSCIVLRGQNDVNVPNEVSVPIGTTANGVYFLHAGAWVTNGAVGGRYTYEYTDGTKAYFDLVVGTHFGNFWGTIDTTYAKTAWNGSNAQTDNISFSIFALSNPHPEKTIKNIILSTDGSTNYLMVIGMTLAKDTLYFDDGGKGVINSDNWLPVENAITNISDNSILDASQFLEKPAGKYGAVKAQGDSFVFENGNKAKFWGTNLVGDACFPTKEKAQITADLIAKCGFNAVRMSDIDSIVFGDNSQEMTDRFMYLVSLFKQRGIYTYLSPVSGKTAAQFFAEEKTDDGINKIKNLLSTLNPYTDMTLAEDPSVAFVEGIDNISMFDFTYGNGVLKITEDEYEKLQKDFAKFLKNKYKTTNALKNAWGYEDSEGLNKNENIENGYVTIPDLWQSSFFPDSRKSDIAEFFVDIQRQYNAKLKKCLESVSYKGVFTGNTNRLCDMYRGMSDQKIKNTLNIGDVYANADTDFVARKAVMSYPYGGYKNSDDHKIIFLSNLSTLNQHDGGLVGELAKNRVLGKPYVVAAYGAAFPNSYATQMMPVMAVMSARNGWTSFNYAFAMDEISDESFINDVYSMYVNPSKMSLAAASAKMFYTTDESTKLYENKMSMKNVLLGNSEDNIKNSMYLAGKYGVTFPDMRVKENTVKWGSDETYISDKSFYWDTDKGIMRYKNDFCDMFSGNMIEKKYSDNYDIDLVSADATVSLISCDDKKINQSNHLLLTVASGATNTDFSTERDYVVFGKAPVKADTVIGNVCLKTDGDWEIYALDEKGERKSQITAEKKSDGYTYFDINKNLHKYEQRALNFEIVNIDNRIAEERTKNEENK